MCEIKYPSVLAQCNVNSVRSFFLYPFNLIGIPSPMYLCFPGFILPSRKSFQKNNGERICALKGISQNKPSLFSTSGLVSNLHKVLSGALRKSKLYSSEKRNPLR